MCTRGRSPRFPLTQDTCQIPALGVFVCDGVLVGSRDFVGRGVLVWGVFVGFSFSAAVHVGVFVTVSVSMAVLIEV